jgi:hypothetical protein
MKPIYVFLAALGLGLGLMPSKALAQTLIAYEPKEARQETLDFKITGTAHLSKIPKTIIGHDIVSHFSANMIVNPDNSIDSFAFSAPHARIDGFNICDSIDYGFKKTEYGFNYYETKDGKTKLLQMPSVDMTMMGFFSKFLALKNTNDLERLVGDYPAIFSIGEGLYVEGKFIRGRIEIKKPSEDKLVLEVYSEKIPKVVGKVSFEYDLHKDGDLVFKQAYNDCFIGHSVAKITVSKK